MPRHSGPRATPATPDEGGRVACGHRSDGSTRTSLLKVAETHDAPAQTIENIAERLAGDDSPADLHGLRHLSSRAYREHREWALYLRSPCAKTVCVEVRTCHAIRLAYRETSPAVACPRRRWLRDASALPPLRQGSAVMADLRNPYDQLSLHRLVVATLVGGILDGTYKTIEDAQIAFERSRQTMSKRRSSFNSEAAVNDDFEPSR
jgi:hypothetical protein